MEWPNPRWGWCSANMRRAEPEPTTTGRRLAAADGGLRILVGTELVYHRGVGLLPSHEEGAAKYVWNL